MNGNGTRRLLKYIIWVLVLCGIIMPHRTANAKPGSIDYWNVVRGKQLSSLAWSPGGSIVAFVATNKSLERDLTGKDACGAETEPCPHLKSADIWLLKPGGAGHPAVLKRLLRLKAEVGISTALFWISDREIAWAADASPKKKGFAFLSTDIVSGKIRYLSRRRFKIDQVRAHWGPSRPGPWCPDDLYWDAKSRKLVFSGATEENHDAIWIYDLNSDKLKKIDMTDVDGYPQWVTFCGIPGSTTSPLYFAGLWPTKDPHTEIDSYGLWTTTSAASRIDARTCQVVIPKRDGLFFPRLSRAGRLAWIQMVYDANFEGVYCLMVQDAINKQKTRRISLSENLYYGFDAEVGLNPALGCPYSWSPDGRRIAYAYGGRIKFFKVVAKH